MESINAAVASLNRRSCTGFFVGEKLSWQTHGFVWLIDAGYGHVLTAGPTHLYKTPQKNEKWGFPSNARFGLV